MRVFNSPLKAGTYVVIGDLMVDEYKLGTVSRISPEAPIPILDYKNHTITPGGAANVAMNLAQAGNQVELIGVIGDDEPGSWLITHLKKAGIVVNGIKVDAQRPTTTKVRYTTTQQSILRVDYESTNPIRASLSEQMAESLFSSVLQNKVDGIMVSDYLKGVVCGDCDTNPVLKIIDEAMRKGVVCGADTKRSGRALRIFRGFTFVKPNVLELEQAVGYKVSLNSLESACKRFLELCGAKSVLVTLGPDGMYHYEGLCGVHVPAIPVNVYDVTGAGDAVFAFITQCLSNGWSWGDSMRLANAAAAIAVQSRGTKVISLDELSERIEYFEKSYPEYFVSPTSETDI